MQIHTNISQKTSLLLLVVLFGCTFCLSKIQSKAENNNHRSVAMLEKQDNSSNKERLFETGKNLVTIFKRGA